MKALEAYTISATVSEMSVSASTTTDVSASVYSSETTVVELPKGEVKVSGEARIDAVVSIVKSKIELVSTSLSVTQEVNSSGTFITVGKGVIRSEVNATLDADVNVSQSIVVTKALEVVMIPPSEGKLDAVVSTLDMSIAGTYNATVSSAWLNATLILNESGVFSDVEEVAVELQNIADVTVKGSVDVEVNVTKPVVLVLPNGGRVEMRGTSYMGVAGTVDVNVTKDLSVRVTVNGTGDVIEVLGGEVNVTGTSDLTTVEVVQSGVTTTLTGIDVKVVLLASKRVDLSIEEGTIKSELMNATMSVNVTAMDVSMEFNASGVFVELLDVLKQVLNITTLDVVNMNVSLTSIDVSSAVPVDVVLPAGYVNVTGTTSVVASTLKMTADMNLKAGRIDAYVEAGSKVVMDVKSGFNLSTSVSSSGTMVLNVTVSGVVVNSSVPVKVVLPDGYTVLADVKTNASVGMSVDVAVSEFNVTGMTVNVTSAEVDVGIREMRLDSDISDLSITEMDISAKGSVTTQRVSRIDVSASIKYLGSEVIGLALAANGSAKVTGLSVVRISTTEVRLDVEGDLTADNLTAVLNHTIPTEIGLGLELNSSGRYVTLSELDVNVTVGEVNITGTVTAEVNASVKMEVMRLGMPESRVVMRDIERVALYINATAAPVDLRLLQEGVEARFVVDPSGVVLNVSRASMYMNVTSTEWINSTVVFEGVVEVYGNTTIKLPLLDVPLKGLNATMYVVLGGNVSLVKTLALNVTVDVGQPTVVKVPAINATLVVDEFEVLANRTEAGVEIVGSVENYIYMPTGTVYLVNVTDISVVVSSAVFENVSIRLLAGELMDLSVAITEEMLEIRSRNVPLNVSVDGFEVSGEANVSIELVTWYGTEKYVMDVGVEATFAGPMVDVNVSASGAAVVSDVVRMEVADIVQEVRPPLNVSVAEMVLNATLRIPQYLYLKPLVVNESGTYVRVESLDVGIVLRDVFVNGTVAVDVMRLVYGGNVMDVRGVSISLNGTSGTGVMAFNGTFVFEREVVIETPVASVELANVSVTAYGSMDIIIYKVVESAVLDLEVNETGIYVSVNRTDLLNV
ncbi:MAG: hypothetical protein DRI39_10255, partial [Chloroflexi bacterium]